MAIKVECRGCWKPFSVKETMAGKRGKCVCGTAILVPAPAQGAPTTAPETSPAAPALSSRRESLTCDQAHGGNMKARQPDLEPRYLVPRLLLSHHPAYHFLTSSPDARRCSDNNHRCRARHVIRLSGLPF